MVGVVALAWFGVAVAELAHAHAVVSANPDATLAWEPVDKIGQTWILGFFSMAIFFLSSAMMAIGRQSVPPKRNERFDELRSRRGMELDNETPL